MQVGTHDPIVKSESMNPSIFVHNSTLSNPVFLSDQSTSLLLYMRRWVLGQWLPSRGSKCNVGFNLYRRENVTLEVRQRLAVKTGLAMSFPPRTYEHVAGRSGWVIKNGMHVLGGVIDLDYTG